MNTSNPFRSRIVQLTLTILLILVGVTFENVTAAELVKMHAGTDAVQRTNSINEPLSSEINKTGSPNAIKWLRATRASLVPATTVQQTVPPVPSCHDTIIANVVAIDQVQTYTVSAPSIPQARPSRACT